MTTTMTTTTCLCRKHTIQTQWHIFLCITWKSTQSLSYGLKQNELLFRFNNKQQYNNQTLEWEKEIRFNLLFCNKAKWNFVQKIKCAGEYNKLCVMCGVWVCVCAWGCMMNRHLQSTRLLNSRPVFLVLNSLTKFSVCNTFLQKSNYDSLDSLPSIIIIRKNWQKKYTHMRWNTMHTIHRYMTKSLYWSDDIHIRINTHETTKKSWVWRSEIERRKLI